MRSPSSSWSKNTTSLDSHQVERRLGGIDFPEGCENFTFEYAIDGKVTVWTKEDLNENHGVIQRVVEVFKIAEDPTLTGGVEKEIEFAFRITGCPQKAMKTTHVYWA